MTSDLRERISHEIVTNNRNPRVKEALIYKGTSLTLQEAVNYAIEQDTLHSTEVYDSEVICAYCNTRGHRGESCIKKERDTRQSNHDDAAKHNDDFGRFTRQRCQCLHG